MTVWTYETVTSPAIPHTTVEAGYMDGEHKIYRIAPIDDYVLHAKSADYEEIDPETLEPTGKTIFQYTGGYATCGANYDFTPVRVTDENGITFTAYGAQREFFARPANEVPADQIYGDVDNNHEVT